MTKLQIPNFLYCSVTGIKVAARREIILQRMKAAGGLERLQKSYISRDCRRLLKEGKTIEQIREELGYHPETANQHIVLTVAKSSSSMARVRTQEGDVVDTFWRSPSWQVPSNWDRIPMTSEQIERTTKDTCIYPSHWLDKQCHKCLVYEQCKLITKGTYRK
jgi:hypothetical protein